MESKSEANSSHLYFAITAAAALGLGLVAYHLSTASSRTKSKNCGFVDWSDTQEVKDKVARAWMERYVRTVLLKGQ